MKISQDINGTNAKLTLDFNDASNVVASILMMHGPTSDSIPGFERGMGLGDEVEACQEERAECHAVIARFEKTMAEISELFPLRCVLHAIFAHVCRLPYAY